MTRILTTAALSLVLGFALIATTGCIRSRAYFTSDPPGAEVAVNSHPIGRTPVEMPFIWYWYYDVQVEKKGYETLKSRERFRTPYYAIFPFDLFAEAFPYPIPDNRHCHYALKRLPAEE